MLIKKGMRVKVLEQWHVVENYEVSVEQLSGTVTLVALDDDGDLELVYVQLDNPLKGLEHYDNILQYNIEDVLNSEGKTLEHYLMHNLELL